MALPCTIQSQLPSPIRFGRCGRRAPWLASAKYQTANGSGTLLYQWKKSRQNAWGRSCDRTETFRFRRALSI